MNSTAKGRSPGTDPLSIAITVIAIAVACLLWAGVLFQLLVTVPNDQRIFDEFRLKLPLLSEFVIGVSRWTMKYWYVNVLALLAFLAVGGVACWAIRHLRLSNVLFLGWILIWMFLPFACNIVIWLAMYLPRQALTEALSR